MRPLMKLYADAGGKVITASIMHKPWNGQTYDAFESMVTWLKKADGTWYFDYTVFDKWVEFMMDLGVKNKSVAILWFPGAFLSNILIRLATLSNFWTPNRVKLLMKNFG